MQGLLSRERHKLAVAWFQVLSTTHPVNLRPQFVRRACGTVPTGKRGRTLACQPAQNLLYLLSKQLRKTAEAEVGEGHDTGSRNADFALSRCRLRILLGQAPCALAESFASKETRRLDAGRVASAQSRPRRSSLLRLHWSPHALRGRETLAWKMCGCSGRLACQDCATSMSDRTHIKLRKTSGNCGPVPVPF